MFPINIVLLPYEELPLHIFESRYKTMIKECINSSLDFGIILKDNNKIFDIGCSASIVEVMQKYDTGEYDVLIRGNKKFNILDLEKEGSIWIGDIDYMEDTENKHNLNLSTAVNDKYVNILLNHKIINNIEKELSRNKSYDYIKRIKLPNSIKQLFLELNNEEERLMFLDDLFSKVVKIDSNINKNRFN